MYINILYCLLVCEDPLSKGNGFCNDENNNYVCDYDGGDCCEPHENSSWNQYCTNCSCLEVPACNPINGK